MTNNRILKAVKEELDTVTKEHTSLLQHLNELAPGVPSLTMEKVIVSLREAVMRIHRLEKELENVEAKIKKYNKDE